MFKIDQVVPYLNNGFYMGIIKKITDNSVLVICDTPAAKAIWDAGGAIGWDIPIDQVFTTEHIQNMRSWVKDCNWREEYDETEIDEMPVLTLLSGVNKHYGGGILQFIKDGY